jgi:hypothetical protein
VKYNKNMFAVFMRFLYEHGNEKLFTNICQIYFREELPD